jgi:Na+/proline symporter
MPSNILILGLLNFIIGIAFGFFHKGKDDYLGILRNGAITGIILGIIFVLISIVLAPGDISTSVGFLGIFGIFIMIILFVIIFIVGVFIGDRIEAHLKK